MNVNVFFQLLAVVVVEEFSPAADLLHLFKWKARDHKFFRFWPLAEVNLFTLIEPGTEFQRVPEMVVFVQDS